MTKPVTHVQLLRLLISLTEMLLSGLCVISYFCLSTHKKPWPLSVNRGRIRGLSEDDLRYKYGAQRIEENLAHGPFKFFLQLNRHLVIWKRTHPLVRLAEGQSPVVIFIVCPGEGGSLGCLMESWFYFTATEHSQRPVVLLWARIHGG